ncbi:hypothetical protein SAMN05880574_10865 [Chryseobacterium sp. RU37D]|uniref:hypothetical protein n=1 Tax=Chryseobacterium sp. RU37D TaxID=1907397 RepID=UPI000953A16D|nr:hypothetical protein [Chryseobacterium sp. RU37D]SIQ23596.1 hypothetical protein SAMN05880574_10865 [Chryseobacterium sp. RU37D]
MKKILLTATMIVGFAAVSQAQQGRVGVNTTTPAATLDVVANTTDATRPDALLVPRMSKTQLAAKDAVYVAAQNGALVFVTDATGTATTKTANVSAPGFYYYDSANSVWVAVGGGGAATPQRYEVIRGNVATVNQANYTVLPTDNLVVTTFNANVNITLPTLTNTVADIGRVVKFANNNTAPSSLIFFDGSGNGTGTSTILKGNFIVNQNRGIELIWTGTTWSSPQK